MKIKINSLFRILFCLFFMFSMDLFSESKTEGEVFLESKKYREAEKYAESALRSNPDDPKVEFILVKAWIGLGYEAYRKGKHKEALEYFEKAQSRWPLNEEIQKEVSKLREKQKNGIVYRSGSERTSTADEWKQEVFGLRSELQELKRFVLTLISVLSLLFILQIFFFVWKFYRKQI